jgi:ATPase subunit of ABC transporter with duplicated ATPase domains
MLQVENLQIRLGARVLLDQVSFRVDKGDKVGLVGRNGAGKTTLTRVISGEMAPTDGSVHVTGEVGYLPQDPRAGDPEATARTRILDARGLGTVMAAMNTASLDMASPD